jgi:hypothetical protein
MALMYYVSRFQRLIYGGWLPRGSIASLNHPELDMYALAELEDFKCMLFTGWIYRFIVFLLNSPGRGRT